MSRLHPNLGEIERRNTSMDLLDYIKEKKWDVYAPNQNKYVNLVFDNPEDAIEELIKLNRGYEVFNVSRSLEGIKKDFEKARNYAYSRKVMMKLNITSKRIISFCTIDLPLDDEFDKDYYIMRGFHKVNFIRKIDKMLELMI